MKMIWRFIKPVKNAMFLGLLIKAVGSLLELLLPYILELILDDVVPTRSVQLILFWSIMMVLCALGCWIFNITANRLASGVARDATREIRHELFDRSLYLSCSKTDAFTIPSLESRLTSDTYNVHRFLGMAQRMGIRAPIIVLGGFAITIFMDPVLSLVLLGTLPFISVLVYIRAVKGIPLYTSVQKKADRMVSVVRENAQGIRVIKALSRVGYEKERFSKVNQDIRNAEIHAQKVMAVVSPGMNLILYLGWTGVLLLGAHRVSLGLSKPGVIIAFMSYFTIISRSLMAISRMFIMASRGLASANRIDEVLKTETEKSWQPGNFPPSDPAYVIEFKDVTFSYLKVRDNLQHISFKLKKGETLGVLGATGSGKTTLLSLLLHFYELDSGAIYLNGEDIRNIPPQELRSRFGIVMQNDFLFSRSISENVRFGREVSEETLKKALENAQASEFVEGLDEGTEYLLTSNATNLSGGQRQRVLLTRAFASDPEILLLDDSSSALDYATDARLRKALAEHYADTTMIIIAQRVSSVRGCDNILLLEDGRIASSGTDEELLKSSELYASICASQMGGALFD